MKIVYFFRQLTAIAARKSRHHVTTKADVSQSCRCQPAKLYLGYVNFKGELFIVGRKDRMIISCGHNIYPEYIERLIKQSGLVDECIVLGEKDALYGEKICCIYISKNQEDNIDEHLRKECMKHLAQYEIPHCFRKCNKFSYTSTGKIVVVK